MSTDYEARFESGTEIEFTGSGEWKSIDCRYSAVPEAVMPANIVAYVKQNFPNVHITKIEKKTAGTTRWNFPTGWTSTSTTTGTTPDSTTNPSVTPTLRIDEGVSK